MRIPRTLQLTLLYGLIFIVACSYQFQTCDIIDTEGNCDFRNSVLNLYGVFDTTSINMYLYQLKAKYFNYKTDLSSSDVVSVIIAAFAFGAGLGGGQAIFRNTDEKQSQKVVRDKDILSNDSSTVTISLPVRPQSSQ